MSLRLPDFYRGLASLHRAGMVTGGALRELRSSGVLPAGLADVEDAISSGGTLSTALARHPEAVPQEDVALIEAGEVTGSLDENLERLALLHDERRRALRRLVTKSLYPLVIFHMAALCIPIGLAGASGRLSFSRTTATTLWILGPFWLLVVLAAVLGRRADWRARMRRLMEYVPAFGAAARHQRHARFASVLEAAYESGVKLDFGLDLAARAAGAPEVAPAAARVGRGETLAAALIATGFLGSRNLGRVATAEKAGELGPTLRAIADEEFAAAETALDVAVGALTKGFYVLLALLVLIYALGVIGSL